MLCRPQWRWLRVTGDVWELRQCSIKTLRLSHACGEGSFTRISWPGAIPLLLTPVCRHLLSTRPWENCGPCIQRSENERFTSFGQVVHFGKILLVVTYISETSEGKENLGGRGAKVERLNCCAARFSLFKRKLLTNYKFFYPGKWLYVQS